MLFLLKKNWVPKIGEIQQNERFRAKPQARKMGRKGEDS